MAALLFAMSLVSQTMPDPPGRGTLVRRRAAPELIQVAWTPDHLPVA